VENIYRSGYAVQIKPDVEAKRIRREDPVPVHPSDSLPQVGEDRYLLG
jgi:hypothetical protein